MKIISQYRTPLTAILIGSIFLLITNETSGQQLPSFSHYYLNPYLYNPAMAGHTGNSEAYFITRRQWGGIDGAPFTSSLTLQLPTKRKLSLGLNINTDTYGVIRNSGALFTTAYSINLTSESSLRGGLSLGVGKSSIDVSSLDADEMLLLTSSNYESNNTYLDGNAGLNYQWRNLNIGLALPRVFKKGVVSKTSFNQVGISKADYKMFLASYKFKVSPLFNIEPQITYRAAQGIPNQYEIYTTAYYKESVWMGASYRQDYGPTLYLGGLIKDKVKIGYAYELSSAQVSGFSNASHEVMISVRFGKKKNKKVFSRAAKIQESKREMNVDTLQTDETEKSKNKISKENSELEENNIAQRTPLTGVAQKRDYEGKTENVKPSPEQNRGKAISRSQSVTGDDTNTRPSTQGGIISIDKPNIKNGEEKVKAKLNSSISIEIQNGHYVIVQAFRVYDNALRYTDKLRAQGIDAAFKFSSKSLFYYVYFIQATELEEGKRQRDIIRLQDQFHDAWLLSVEE